MSSIYNALNIGYSGLNAAQIGIDTTSQNIANAESEGYTRQRVVTSAATPISSYPGQVGNGAEVTDISRVFDNFVFDRYNSVSADKEYSDYEKKTLETLSTYFPEIEGVGVKSDLTEYYNMWDTFADNPDNDSVKTALVKQTETLTDSITQTQDQIKTLQDQVNDDIAADVNEVNDLASQLADLNVQIDTAESNGATANDLRDKRNVLERSLSRLIGADVNQGQLESNIQLDSDANIAYGSYTLSVNGFNIVDGSSYHPLTLSNEGNASGFYSISYERQDGTLIPMEESITDGEIGAALDLRGGTIDTTSGMPTDGTLQTTISQMDAFAQGLIESTNNLYAQNSTTNMQSNAVDFAGTEPLLNSGSNIKKGSFDVVAYDVDGNEVSRRSVNIDAGTTMTGGDNSNSIENQLARNTDDNDDNNGTNDIDDIINFSFATSQAGGTQLDLSVNSEFQALGYTFAIEDNLTDDSFSSGTNFAGALGLGRYFDGDNASNIKVANEYRDNPTLVSAGYSSSSGDNQLALDMVQQQYESYDYKVGNQVYNTTSYGMFDITATSVGIATNSAITNNETITTQFNATEIEYFSTSKVSIDEEMTNLIKYQTAYSASAQVITTIDEMMKTLLGIKR
jgi:flagellar hook-associated protein 1 FlgK